MSPSVFSRLPRSRWTLSAALSTLLVLVATPATAARIALEGLVFSEVAGDFRITGGEATPNTLRLFQEVTGPRIDLFTSIEGLPDTPFLGFRFESILTNRTDTPWVFFDHELQEQFKVPSPEADGLSFAQQFSVFRPFTSNAYSVVDEVTDVRDFVNFSGGVVNPGQTVTFRYVILDNSPIDRFFLRQRPNFAPGGVGVVAPLPVTPPPVTPPTTPTPVTPPVTPSPVTPPPAAFPPPSAPDASPVPETPRPETPQAPDAQPSTPPTAIPEPGMVIGLLWLSGLGLLKRVTRP